MIKRLYAYLHCPWCWSMLHLMHWYPGEWTSTICPHHERAVRVTLAQRRAARARSPQMEVC